MIIKKYKHPLLFYALSTLIPWILWFVSAYISHNHESNQQVVLLSRVLGFLGLISPFVISLFLILPNQELKKDFINRVFYFKSVKLRYWLVAFGLMLLSILLAQLISLLFGYSANQFILADTYSFTSGIFPVWLLLFFAPLIEELAWHSYGTDCLRARWNLFKTSIIFAFYWGIWHLPLSFIKNYYHSNLIETGVIYSLNFFLSLFPFVIIMNWLYYKAKRNILITIIFHITAGYFNEIFTTHPMSKVIQTVLLILLSAYLIINDKDFFFKKLFKVKLKTCE